MFVFWAVAGLLAAGAAGLIMIRAAGAARDAAAADPAPALYRRQLAEIDDLAERGLLAEPERQSARAEAGRRLLDASEAPIAAWNVGPGGRRAALAAGLAAPALALGLYLSLGSPETPDQPFAQRLNGWQHADLRTLTAPEIAAVLRKAVGQRPNEAEGFRLLGLAESASGNPFAAVRALRRAAELAPNEADIWQLLGEAEMAEDGGKVGEGAQAAFRRLLQLQPGDPNARFFLARARAEGGDRAGAVSDLNALVADLPAADDRRKAVEAEIAQLQNKPASEVDPQQMAMIRGMVARLAARLQTAPDDPNGWVRLVRAYAVLGDTAKRDAAYASARARYSGKPDVLEALDEAARAETMQ